MDIHKSGDDVFYRSHFCMHVLSKPLHLPHSWCADGEVSDGIIAPSFKPEALFGFKFKVLGLG